MNSRILLRVALASISLAAGACDQSSDKDSARRNPAPSGGSSGTAADNTGRNRADRDTQAKTPIDQSNSSADVKITADIRRAILDDKSMSTNAQNCKIITDASGTVTLRGPVDSQAEKDAIESKARAIVGVKRVVNELEVKVK